MLKLIKKFMISKIKKEFKNETDKFSIEFSEKTIKRIENIKTYKELFNFIQWLNE